MNIDIEKFKAEVNLKKNYQQLSKEFNCSIKTIKRYAQELNLKVETKICKSNDPEVIEKVKELLNKNKTNLEISQELGISPTTARKYTKLLGKDTNTSRNKTLKAPVILTKEQEEVIYGSMLGDMSLGKTQKSYRFVISQGGGHEEYFDHIAKIFSNILGKINKTPRYDKRTKLFYNKFVAKFLASESYKKYYDIMVINGKKTVTKEWANRLTARGLAYWFMDDGCINGVLATNGFTLDEVKLLSETLLNKFNIHSDVQKVSKKQQWLLHIRTVDRKLFEDIIRPYIVPSMEYKLKYK